MHSAIVVGTRPEAIKLGPLVLELRRQGVDTSIIHTGQHADLVRDPFELFGIDPTVTLDTMRTGQSLPGLVARLGGMLTEAITAIHDAGPIDVLVVQGDTASTMIASLVGGELSIPVAHVEAGLRTGDVHDPFPEEVNRMIVSMVAAHHFAPTQRARDNLMTEGIDPSAITITGNTAVDAVRFVLETYGDRLEADRDRLGLTGLRYVAMTVHRRESWGEKMRSILSGVRDSIEDHPDVSVVFPVHPNPVVREAADEILSGVPNVTLVRPAGYREFVAMLQGAAVIVTDSGGIQEEAPTLGKHTLVVRMATERTEGLEAGTATLVGVDREAVAEAIGNALAEAPQPPVANPFGDGMASERIVTELVARYS